MRYIHIYNYRSLSLVFFSHSAHSFLLLLTNYLSLSHLSTNQAMASPVDELTSEIFSILENKFLFGSHNQHRHTNAKVGILSIDSGGDGILAAQTLLRLQSILRLKSGNPTAHLADFFDVAAGAGAGGILVGLLFTRRPKDGRPLFTAEESLKFMLDNRKKLEPRGGGLLCSLRGKGNALHKVLNNVFGQLTLKDCCVKSVLIPCYDLMSGAPFLFSRADAMEMADFRMAAVCGATAADGRAVELRSTDGRKKIVAIGGGVGNPTAAAITHVVNNKKEFPMCRGVEDLLVLSLGKGCPETSSSLEQIAAHTAADMVGNGIGSVNMVSSADEMLGQNNVESVLFKGRKVSEFTNMEKMEMFARELIKEKERRNNNNNNNNNKAPNHNHRNQILT
ncbi:patatin-like protein 6 [Striga asiatica]|uniref:Patatin-like protein 6 n=1 Tax=Striga asiatica TaxID=4170 RepID=A0A5A7R594_STRAF|nr:patatin-like protein 6 [Striga asiatica]